ncbi:MAG: insulinase family protein [Desulfobulbaceae bacterium]|jgi:Zn-dependent M16 (insulinase) family peptidase|nr:insulinase family protein [Desulfobulbaceae bacterium]
MQFTVNQSYSGFILEKYQTLAEIDSQVFLFRHATTGCPFVAIKNRDSNKTFSVAFNTIPTDSTGVAHILEHSVLMGSKKYPVKDVFGEVHKGGLMTFLNAMTGADITYYPFATRNMREYFNLMDIYCDVVFNPLLSRSTFEQEGWHYHQEDAASPMTFQGVVFNEMKGAFSDPIRAIFHNIYRGLMPGSTYAHESGGDPKRIPDLTYEEFVAFHRRHYHPSNAMFFVYGDADLAEELRFLNENFLAAYPERSELCRVELGTDRNEPIFLRDTYAVDGVEAVGKTYLAVGSKVGTALELRENMALHILSGILYNSDASPLKNAIIGSGLCKDFGGLYLSSSSFSTVMLTYLVGSEGEHRDAFLDLYRKTLTEMVEQGLDRDLLISELNRFEFALREENSKAQRGLDLIGKAMSALKYGADLFASLTNEEMLKSVRRAALEERFFEKLIAERLLDQAATAVLTLSPDPNKQANSQAEENARLAAHAERLDAAGREALVARAQNLLEEQRRPNSPETLALLPQLAIADLRDDIEMYEARPSEFFGCQALVHELPTGGITSLDLGFDVRALPPRFLPWLDIFAVIVTEIGTKRLDYIAFAKEIATHTGSFSHSIAAYSHRSQPARPLIWLHMKCLPGSLAEALALVAEVLADVSFADRRRIAEIVQREFAWSEHAAQSEGYELAAARAMAHLGEAGHYHELCSGVTAYLALKELAGHYQENEEEFLAALAEMARRLFVRDNLFVSVTGRGQELDVVRRSGECLIVNLPMASQGERHALPLFGQPAHEAFITASEVVFCVQAANLFTNGQGYNGHFEALKTWLSRDYLWNTVRQMGGAYGCFIQASSISGNFACISYRDPQVRKTYAAYQDMAEKVAALNLDQRALAQLILGAYGACDPHLSAIGKGVTARNEYLMGVTAAEKRQRLREIIGVTNEHLREFAAKFAAMLPLAHRSIIGNRGKIEGGRELFDRIYEL